MKTEKIYDIIGIGIGPFNLGLAALANDIQELKCMFFDKSESFNWHPGLLLPNARLQVPFYADLVTLVNPCSKFSYMAFLKAKNRLFRFAIHENNFATRLEFNCYCRWVIAQLKNLQFGMECQAIHYNKEKDCYDVYFSNKELGNTYVFHCKRIVIGVGSVPNIPKFAKNIDSKLIFHSGEYLNHKEAILSKYDISIIGSGQSAAEIFYDLLQYEGHKLNWFTRSARFYPMEYSKLSLEMTSPDYVDHFYNLDVDVKQSVLKGQDVLYKGINYSLINEIYDQLYLKSLDERNIMPGLSTNCELEDIKHYAEAFSLRFNHKETESEFEKTTEVVILATGYKHLTPEFIEPIRDFINWMDDGNYRLRRNYSVDDNNTIFVQNAELHSHGYNSADIGFGPYRNATILNTILGCEHFCLERGIAFQSFSG